MSDTFGVATAVRSATKSTDPAPGGGCSCSTGAGDARGTAVPAAGARRPALEAAPRERVAIARDELANLAWAVEELVESRHGAPIGVTRRLSRPACRRRRRRRAQLRGRHRDRSGAGIRWSSSRKSPGQRRWNNAAPRRRRAPCSSSGAAAVLEEEIPGEGLGSRAGVPARPLAAGPHRDLVRSPAHRRRDPDVERFALRRRPPDPQRLAPPRGLCRLRRPNLVSSHDTVDSNPAGRSAESTVFLLSRIKEVHDDTSDNDLAVAVGLQRSGLHHHLRRRAHRRGLRRLRHRGGPGREAARCRAGHRRRHRRHVWSAHCSCQPR